jgi:hypothetical protein
LAVERLGMADRGCVGMVVVMALERGRRERKREKAMGKRKSGEMEEKEREESILHFFYSIKSSSIELQTTLK